jgi:hypothetical protein
MVRDAPASTQPALLPRRALLPQRLLHGLLDR